MRQKFTMGWIKKEMGVKSMENEVGKKGNAAEYETEGKNK